MYIFSKFTHIWLVFYLIKSTVVYMEDDIENPSKHIDPLTAELLEKYFKAKDLEKISKKPSYTDFYVDGESHLANKLVNIDDFGKRSRERFWKSHQVEEEVTEVEK